MDAVTEGGGADDVVNTATVGVGKLSVAEMGGMGASRLPVGPVRCTGPRTQRPVIQTSYRSISAWVSVNPQSEKIKRD